jgi:ADP-heptose:LPS heptosyltransferase
MNSIGADRSFRREPLLNGKNSSGRSAEEIKEILEKVSRNIIALEKYKESLEEGRALVKTGRKDNQSIMLNTANLLRNAKLLLSGYSGTDQPIYLRKLANCSEKVEEIMQEIKEKEDRDLIDIRKSVARMTEYEDHEESQKGNS